MNVMRRAALVAVSALVTTVASDVRAQNRPDLLEVGPVSTALVRADGLDYVFVDFRDIPLGPSSGANHRQSIRVAHEFPGIDGLTFRIYEPDKVTRKPNQVKWQQDDHLLARIVLAAPPSPYNTFTAYGVVTGCKGKAQVKTVNAVNEAKYSFGCRSATDVMDQLAVPAGLQPYILNLFGPKFTFKGQGALP